MKITATWLASRQEPRARPKVRRDINVDGRQGFVVRLHPSGAISFRFRYQRDGRRHWMVLGEYGAGGLTLADAHDLHHQAQRELEKGLDPILERRHRETEAEKARQRQTAANAVTVRNVIAEWGWHWARRERKRPREAIRLLRVYLKPWMGQPVQEKRRRDAIVLLDAIVARGSLVMANRIRDLANQAFTFCVARDLISVNPFLGVPAPGGDEESKDRFLTREEIKIFWNKVDAPRSERPGKRSQGRRRPPPKISRRQSLALKLVLVTAQRPGEVIKARFDQFDLAERAWTIPPEVIKTVKKTKRRGKGKAGERRQPRAHVVPLTDLAIELLEELRALAKGHPCLLPAHRAKIYPDGHIDEKALAHALRDQIDEKNGTLFELEPFTPHDLRRTAATTMTALGVPRHPDVAKVLNHAEKDDDTTRIYDRWEYWPQKQHAMKVWETELRAIIEGKTPIGVKGA